MTTVVSDDPLILGVSALVTVALVLILHRLWLRARWERADHPGFRIEPNIGPGRQEPRGREEPDGLGAGPRQPAARPGARRRPALAFLVGVAVGVFVLPWAIRHGAGPASEAAGAIAEGLAGVLSETDPTTVASIDAGDQAAGPAANFVAALQKELPKRMDDRTTLVSVDGNDDVITLGHRVSEALSDADAGKFAETTKDQIVSGTCAPIADSNIRTLNDEGVEFRFIYADTRGDTIAAITLEPNFCGSVR